MAAPDAKERELLTQFRNRLASVSLTEDQSQDHFLIRWLRAREHDLDRAEEMLLAHLNWRKEIGAEALLSWEAPAELKKLCPVDIIGYDNNNIPVVFLPYGRWNLTKVVELKLNEDAKKYMSQIYLKAEDSMKGRLTKDGLPVTQFYYIVDSKNLGMRQFANLQVMDIVSHVAKSFEANHPEVLRKCIALNSSRVFTVFYSLVRPFLSPNTVEKIKVFGTSADSWKPLLLADIPPSVLPPHLGGTNTALESLDNSECVQEEEEEEPEFASVTVPRGELLNIAIGVDAGGSVIDWAFRTDKHDISFGVKRDGKAYIENQKVESHVNLQEGKIQCDAPGDYIFTFDNTYARMRDKLLEYRIDVKSASGQKQISFD